MRPITLLCTPCLFLLCLTSCGGPAGKGPSKPPDEPVIKSDDSSPIIIADGSIDLKHGKPKRNHFRSLTPPPPGAPKTGEIYHQDYKPKGLGNQYDPSSGVCGPPSGSTLAKGKCFDLLNVDKWDLYLCKAGPPCPDKGDIMITFRGTDKNTMAVTANNGSFQYTPADERVSGKLAWGGINDRVQSATFVVDPDGKARASYAIDCSSVSKTDACLVIDYHCAGDNCCPNDGSVCRN